jgi:L-malate glycosyltransferase
MHLLIIPSYYPNSYNPIDGIYFKVQAESLKTAGLKIGVVAPIIIKHYVLKRERRIDFGYKITHNGIPTYLYQFPSFPIFKKANDLLRLYYGKKLFRKYIIMNGLPDIIHLHSFENGILTRWIKKIYKIQYVTTEHSSGFQRKIYTKWKLQLAIKAYQETIKLVTVSTALKNTLKRLFDIEAITIGNMIDIDFFVPITEEKKYDFITVGGLQPTKNYPLLIDSFGHVCGKYPELRLAIVGNGPLKDQINNKIEKSDFTQNIEMLGSQSPSEILHLLNQSSIFVSSSKIETFGVAIIEAMSCGLPVVSTKSGGPEDLIIDESFGILCDHNPESLYNAMINVFENIDYYNNNKIREYIINNFSSQAVCNQLQSIYKEVVNPS